MEAGAGCAVRTDRWCQISNAAQFLALASRVERKIVALPDECEYELLCNARARVVG